MPTVVDFFRDDPAFRLIEMTDYVNRVPYVPTFLGALGVYSPTGVPTTRVAVQRDTGTISLVHSQPRSAPRNSIVRPTRQVIDLDIPHLPQTDQIVPDEVQDVRALGNNATLATAEQFRNERLMQMTRNDDLTQEYHRVGAFLGTVLDADGATLLNSFTAFGITQESDVGISLSSATSAVLAAALNSIRRTMEDNLNMGQAEVGMMLALVGDTYFDELVGRADVQESMIRGVEMLRMMGMSDATISTMEAPDFLRHNWAFKAFIWDDVLWYNYRGKNPADDTPFIGAQKAHFAPYMPGTNLFKVYYGPRNRLDGVNMPGLPRFADSYVDPKGRYIDVDYESNPLYVCTRPEVLMVSTNS